MKIIGNNKTATFRASYLSDAFFITSENANALKQGEIIDITDNIAVTLIRAGIADPVTSEESEDVADMSPAIDEEEH